MKKLHQFTILIGFAIASGFFSCEKTSITEMNIEGHWVNLTLTHPDWQYEFQGNILTQYVIDFGDTIALQEYTYAVRHDTILIGGDTNNPARKWKVTFWCDVVAEVHNITPGLQIAPVLYLRKTQ